MATAATTPWCRSSVKNCGAEQGTCALGDASLAASCARVARRIAQRRSGLECAERNRATLATATQPYIGTTRESAIASASSAGGRIASQSRCRRIVIEARLAGPRMRDSHASRRSLINACARAALQPSASFACVNLARGIAVKDMPMMTRTAAVQRDRERLPMERVREPVRERVQPAPERTRDGPEIGR